MASKRLISEADVRSMARGSVLQLGSDVIATPSALDAAFERGIRVVRSESSAAGTASVASCGCGGACGGGAACAWAKMMQQDATYVVVVRGGVATVARLTDQGPVPFA